MDTASSRRERIRIPMFLWNLKYDNHPDSRCAWSSCKWMMQQATGRFRNCSLEWRKMLSIVIPTKKGPSVSKD